MGYNIQKRMALNITVENAEFFVIYKDEEWEISDSRMRKTTWFIRREKQVKLHQIYLHQKHKAKGKMLAVKRKVKTKPTGIIWLDVMDACQLLIFIKNQGANIPFSYTFFYLLSLMLKGFEISVQKVKLFFRQCFYQPKKLNGLNTKTSNRTNKIKYSNIFFAEIVFFIT
jgi:hypothetical protein